MAARFLYPLILERNLIERRRKRRLRIRNKELRDVSDPFSLPEENFKQIFRLSRDLGRYLVITLTPHLRSGVRITSIPVFIKVLATLQFLSSGSYQRYTGLSNFFGLSQASMSRCIDEVCTVICDNMLNIWVKFPINQVEIQQVKLEFLERFNFSGILGCVDGTHVAIVAPPENDPVHPGFVYYNRKGFYSINVQIICDANLKILAINARYPGSTHDSAIWQMSRIRRHLEEQFLLNRLNGWLLGDSGYPLEPYLLTPVLNTNTEAEERYNNAHCFARNSVERCIGLLKARFRCLLKHRTLHYNPVKAGIIVYSCAILHNIAILRNEPIINDDEILDNVLDNHDNLLPANNGNNAGHRIRNQVINNYFT